MQAGKLAAIGQLAAGVAHEINNPLTVINANAEMLKMIVPAGSDEMEMIDLIHRAGDRATKVVRGLLNSARQEEYDFTMMDLNESIEAAIELVSFQLQAAEIELRQEMDSSLPLVLASNEHLKSVWINLLVNASDAVSEMAGERRIELISRLSPDQQYIQVVVVDNGAGMNAAQLGHIFEPFYTTKDPDKGTGLGLATCYRIIEQHGGQIDVLSDPGEGTTFIVVLPVAMAADEATVM
jgi:two-component system NtrC family sensor kinase